MHYKPQNPESGYTEIPCSTRNRF